MSRTVSAALGASYIWNLSQYGLLDASVMHAYRGESRCNADSQFQGTCQVSPNFNVGEATNRTDLRLAWSSAGDRWGVAAYLTNAFDERYVTGVNNLTTNTFGTPFASISEPRMWGLEFRYTTAYLPQSRSTGGLVAAGCVCLAALRVYRAS